MASSGFDTSLVVPKAEQANDMTLILETSKLLFVLSFEFAMAGGCKRK